MLNEKKQTNEPSTKLLDLEKYRLKLKLRDAGVEWHEDMQGKFKIWVRMSAPQTSPV